MIDCPACSASVPELSRFCSICGYAIGGVAVTDPPVVDAARPSEIERRLSQALTGRYRIGKLLGQGGMGAVFLADDLELDRQVAIKVLPTTSGSDANFVERFRREARTAARLDHPNIIPIYGVESSGELHYFVMRFVPGRSLEDVLADQPKLDLEQTRHILVEAAKALGHAHRHEIVHRDVKPANIMLEGNDRVVLTDFGISKAVQATTSLTSTGMIIGTPTYMAPEQARGVPVDGRTDQYALAAVGYEMLVGHPPFESDDVFALMFKHMNDAPPALREERPDVPAPLERTILKSLAKEPADRFDSMESFVAALDPSAVHAAATVRMSAAPTARIARPRPAGRRPMAAAIGVLGIVGVGLGVGYAVLKPPVRSAALSPLSVGDSRLGVPDTATASPGIESADPALTRRGDLAATATAPPESSLTRGRSIAKEPTASGPTPVDPGPRTPARSQSSTDQVNGPGRRPVRSRPRPALSDRLANAAERAVVQRARLTIGVDGSYGTVYIDGRLIGESPIVRQVTFGEHEIRIEREGFKTIRQRILVNGPTTRRFTLEPARQP